MSITWQPNCLELLRNLINDVDTANQTYSDARLTKLLISAAFSVLREADFPNDFVVNIAAQTIVPDPTDTTAGTNDENFVNLICLKAACILAQGAAIAAASAATAGKDMDSAWDLRSVATNTIALLDKGWCKLYEEALEDYIYGSGVVGAAVMSPFRTRNRGIYPYY